jgi:HD-GYP domain-containing protein (c-di-GMP phosphodiesterase class II)
MNRRRGIEFGIVGLGGCGGKLAEIFFRLGYPSIAVNTSSAELSSLSLPEDQRLLLGSGEGSGGDMDRAREAIEERADLVRERSSSLLEKAERLILASGIGGGTGGNLHLVADVLRGLDKPISSIVILPADFEGTQVKMNAVQALDRLLNVEAGSVLLIDNRRFLKAQREKGMIELYGRINDMIATTIDELNGINYDESLLPIYPMDPSDLGSLLSQRGILTFARIDLNPDDLLSPGRFIFKMWDGMWRSTPISGIDPTTASGCGVVLIAPEEAMASGGELCFEALLEHIGQVTDGCVIYSGLLIAQKEMTRLYLILSGLDLPEGINELREQAQKEWDQLQSKKLRWGEAPEAEKEAPPSEIETLQLPEGLTPEEIESLKLGESPQEIRDSFRGLIERLGSLSSLGEEEVSALRKFADKLVDMSAGSKDLLLMAAGEYPEMKGFLGFHSFNVASLSAYLGREMKLNDDELRTLILAALIHDLGMFKLPEELVFAPRKLTDEEMGEIRRHPELGAEMVRSSPTLPIEAPMVLIHEHERSDGSGYPEGISGDEIHPFARIVSVCDVFEAISHRRPHRDPFLPYEAMRQVIEMSRVQLDYKVVRSFVALMSIYPIGSFVQLSTDEIAQVVDSVSGYPFHPVVKVIEIEEGRIKAQDMVYYLKDETGIRIVGPIDPLRPKTS